MTGITSSTKRPVLVELAQNLQIRNIKDPKKRCKITFGNRSSIYRGVTRHENGRCEAFVWDNTDPQETAKTSEFEHEENADRAHDLAALKLWGESAALNFHLSEYEKDLEEMKSYSKKDYFLHIRRNMTGFAKGISNYRGVSKNADNKKWQARLGKCRDIDSIYVGTFDTQEEAARAYDIAAIRVRGWRAMTNFDISKYDVQQILDSTKFPIKGASKKLRRSSVDDVLRKRSNTRNIPVLKLNVDSSGNPSLTSSEQMEPTIQFQPVQPIEKNEFPFHQKYNRNSQHHLHQNPSSNLRQETQNPNSQTNPNFLAGENNLASDSYIKEFPSSHGDDTMK
ncbi:hypothetical protein M0R45_030292 [Rubus argutus]|uniref:AP2/ERF domain-containing protein n=1 Tax=Rubus argutus TaxID=59490 RepID=A0AAW1WAV4_RUBAR